MKIDVSFVVPAYNEEKNLPLAVQCLRREIKNSVKSYQIVIVNDGSTDNTGKIADTLAAKSRDIKVIHHEVNRGFGQTFLDGVKNSQKKYIIGFPGDNDTSAASIKDIILQYDKADLIISYTSNPGDRSVFRRIFSSSFVLIMNKILNLNLKYYNGSFLCERLELLNLNLKSRGFTIYAEAKIYLIKKGASYIEVPFKHIGRKFGKTKTTNISTLLQTLEFMWIIITKYY